jgi:hypothetical protein
MDVHFGYASEPEATYSQTTTYHYKSKTSELPEGATDAAKAEFINNIAPEHWYHGGYAHLIYSDNHKHKPYDETKLKSLPLYNYHRLGYRYCPDDKLINTTANKCVIDGLLSFLKLHYTTLMADKLKQELGSAHPSVDDIERWVKSDKHSYQDYVSLYILDPFNRQMLRHIAKNNTKVMMTFYVNHQHLYAITLKDLRTKIQHYDHVDLMKLEHRDALLPDNYEYIHCNHIKKPTGLLSADQRAKFVLAQTLALADKLKDCSKPYVLVEAIDLSGLAKILQSETQTMIPQLTFEGYYHVNRFEHPTTHQTVIAAPNFRERKNIADQLFADTGYTGFEFVNQSYYQLARMSFELEFGKLPLESYGPEQIDLLEQFPIAPFTCRTGKEICDEGVVSIDIRNAYLSVFLNNDDDYPIFNFWDKKEPYHESMDLPVGEYYIDCKLRTANDNFVKRHGAYSRNTIKYALERGYITHANIKYVREASGSRTANTFRKFTENMHNKFGEQAKHLVNHLIGGLGIQFHKQNEGCITDSFETAVGTMLHYNDGSVDFNKIGDTYFIQRKTATRQYTGHVFLHRHILAACYIALDKLYHTVTNRGKIPRVVVAWNTDSMKLRLDAPPMGVKATKAECKPGEYYVEDKCIIRGRSMHDIANECTAPIESEPKPWITGDTGQSLLVLGKPGSCKTKQLTEDDIPKAHEAKKKVVTLTYTCASASNVRGRCKVDSPNVMTFDAFFYDSDHADKKKKKKDDDDMRCPQSWITKASAMDIIFIDEGFQPPKRYFFYLYQAKMFNPNLIIRIFGDYRQCTPMEKYWVDYMECALFRSLVDCRTIEKPYNPETCRFETVEFKEAVDQIWDDGRVPPLLANQKLHTDVALSMCHTDATSRSWTRERENRKQHYASLAKSAESSQYAVGSERYATGEPIVACANVKEYGVVTTTTSPLCRRVRRL